LQRTFSLYISPLSAFSTIFAASFGATLCNIISGFPGRYTFTSGSPAQNPKQPTFPSSMPDFFLRISFSSALYTSSAPLPMPQVPMPTDMRSRPENISLKRFSLKMSRCFMSDILISSYLRGSVL